MSFSLIVIFSTYILYTVILYQIGIKNDWQIQRIKYGLCKGKKVGV